MNKKLEMYFEDACDILDSLDIEYGPVKEVKINSRATSRWGMCRRNRYEDSYSIEISSELLKDDVSYEAVMDTMIHELLHTHKDRMCHTGEWKRCANLVNEVYGYNIKRCTSAAEKNIDMEKKVQPYKYNVVCNNCGRSYGYRKKSKVIKSLLMHPHNHDCTCCCGSSDLTLYKL